MGRYVEEITDTQPITLDDVDNVTVPSPNDGDLIVYDNTNSEWVNVDNVVGGTF